MIEFKGNTLFISNAYSEQRKLELPQRIKEAVAFKEFFILTIWRGDQKENMENLICFDSHLKEVWRQKTPYAEKGVDDSFGGLSISDSKLYIGNFLGWQWKLDPASGELTNPVFHK